MQNKNIKKNYIYNLSYQILLLITPLVTTPYLSQVLEADGIGEVSYAESVVSYFTLFAILGISIYGQREISYAQDNKGKRTQVFWETKILEIITSLVVLLVYIPFALGQKHYILYLILSFNILAVLMDVTWFFQGMEEFGKIVLRNVVLKVISIVYIFSVVKTRENLQHYVFGLAFFPFIGNVSLWGYLPQYISRLDIKSITPFKNLKTVLSLFVPTIAIQIYTVLDKTMIGLITRSAFENGYYEQAIKISKMALVVITSMATVMVPRIGYYYGCGETEKVKLYMYRGYRFVWFLGIPLCFGLIGIASNFVPWFFGKGYEKVIPLLKLLSFLVIDIGISNETGIQYLIPTKRQNVLSRTVIIGAAVNFVLNITLIPIFHSVGAAIASVVAETIITLLQLYYVRKEFSIISILFSSLHYFVAGGTMLFVLKVIGNALDASIIHTLLLILIGVIVYCGILIGLKDSFLLENIQRILKKIKI